MQQRVCDVSPTGDQDKYTVAIVDQAGEWVGFDADLTGVIQHSQGAPPPINAIDMATFHKGKGAIRYTPDGYRFKNSSNAWRTTPGKFHATLLPEFAKGLRNEDRALPDANGVKFEPLVGAQLSQAVSFTASATYSADAAYIYLRKGVPAGTTGTPSTCTLVLVADATGSPGTVSLATVTVTSTDVSDVTSMLYKFAFSSPVSLTSGNTYWIKIVGTTGATHNNAWEIGTDPSTAGKIASSQNGTYSASTFSPYFRVTDADVNRQVHMFNYKSAMYAVTVPDAATAGKIYINGMRGKATSGNTTTLTDTGGGQHGAGAIPADRYIGWQIKIVDGTGAGQVRTITDNGTASFTVSAWDVNPDNTSEYVVFGGLWFKEIATMTAKSTGRPVVTERLVYFPAGDTTAIMSMGLDYTDADDHVFDSQTKTGTSGCATGLAAGYDASIGNLLWRFNRNSGTGSGGNGAVSFSTNLANAAYNTDLAWNTAVVPGEITSQIQNIVFHSNSLHVLKEDTLYLVQNNRPFQVQIGSESNPSSKNGLAACTATDKNLYVARGPEVLAIMGQSALPTMLPESLPVGKSGTVSDIISVEGWVFAAVDAGSSGTSGVYMFAIDTATWANHLDGYAVGKRIRNLLWHPVEGSHPELWCDMGGDLVRQQFPRYGVRPYNDTACKYYHEAVIELPEFDMNTTEGKYYSKLYASLRNLTVEGDTTTGKEVFVEIQTDNDIDGATWYFAGKMGNSPTDKVSIDKGGARNIATRLRLLSSDALKPVILEKLRLTLFYRTQLSHAWQIQFKLYPDDDEQPTIRMLEWLRNKAKSAEVLTMKSTFRLYHNRNVTLTNEPYYNVQDFSADEDEVEALISVMLSEVV